MKAAEEDYRRALDLAGPERVGAPRGTDPREPRGDPLLARRVRTRGPGTRTRLKLGDGDLAVRAQASRFLGDIELSILGDAKRAAELLDDALDAARGLGDPWTLARTLLVAAWAPYFRQDTEGAARCSRRRSRPRANPEGDRWSEARSLVGLSTLESDEGDEEARSGSQRRRSRSRRPVGTASRSPSPTRRWRHAAPHDAPRGRQSLTWPARSTRSVGSAHAGPRARSRRGGSSDGWPARRTRP